MATTKQSPTNMAAYLTGPKVKPLKVSSAPYTLPKAGQVTVRNRAIAINPIDRVKQDMGNFLYGHIKYPFVLGYDLAGDIVEVGSGVTQFKVGDRVLGFAVGMEKDRNTSTESAFQHYTVVPERLVSRIPDWMKFEDASVIPLGVSTAAAGLYEKDQLALPYPSLTPTPTGKMVIVWGGSTSVGANAIQLAVASGYEVITTCSPRNFDFVKRLGAARAFDYNSKTIVRDIAAALEGKTLSGALTIGTGGAEACLEIMNQSICERKFVAMVSFPTPDPAPESLVIPRTVAHYMSWSVQWWLKCRVHGVKSNLVWGASPANTGICKAVFGEYLPQALEKGVFVPAPEAQVFGHGLERIQGAFEAQKKVSGKKLVISL
jgi:NADPH:quinone reductase-like Zn-dependent oxidoreductase